MICAQPLVSVIIPTYNRERHLAQCLQSVLAQTYSCLEVIVVDDGSTDGTEELIRAIAVTDDRIRYLKKDNGGVSSARNLGIRESRGELIALLDSDDAWLPWKLEVQVAALLALPQVGMIWTDMMAIDEQGKLLHDRYLRRMYGAYRKLTGPLFTDFISVDVPESLRHSRPSLQVGFGEIYPQMLRGNLVHTSTVLIRKEWALATGLFDERYLRAGEDYGFHLRTCRLGPVALLDESSTLYRIGLDDQLTHRRNQVGLAQAFLQTITDEVAAANGNVPLSDKELREILSEAHTWLGTELRTAGESRKAITHLLDAIACNWFNLTAWGQLAKTIIPPRMRRWLKRLLLGPSVPPAVSPSRETTKFESSAPAASCRQRQSSTMLVSLNDHGSERFSEFTCSPSSREIVRPS